MSESRIRDIVIVGGGTAGWMAAALLSKVAGTQAHRITLIESEEIGTVGVGEATIPAIQLFNNQLDLDEDEFVRATNATFKLGIEFVDWRRLGHTYFHNFGLYGAEIRNGAPFVSYWLRWVASGGDPDHLRFSLEAEAAREGKFGRAARMPGGQAPRVNYAFQFDAATYAAYLRRYSERRGVVRQEGRIIGVQQNGETGFIESVETSDGRRFGGDLFIDCSGFRGLLIEGALNAGFDDWSEWLPNNRAVAVPCERVGETTPYTQARAREAGWQWRIPLQHRTGNGYVYSSNFIDNDAAIEDLRGRMDGAALAEPNLLRFVTGRRRKAWNRNCVSLGLACGFVEPLESTSLNLIQTGVGRLLDLFPDLDFDPVLTQEYNRRSTEEVERIRDFIILHYHLARRPGPLWDYCRAMTLPDALADKIALFRARGEIALLDHESFREASWAAIFTGLGVWPERWSPLTDQIPADAALEQMKRRANLIRQAAGSVPPHDRFLAELAPSVTA